MPKFSVIIDLHVCIQVEADDAIPALDKVHGMSLDQMEDAVIELGQRNPSIPCQFRLESTTELAKEE